MPAPSLLERKLLPKVWGGRRLEATFGLRLPPGTAIGEAWEVYDRPEASSRGRGGGPTLREWMQQDPQALLGRGVRPVAGGRFPLAVKWIDATEALSVQVHPDDADAVAAGESGKSEAWVVVAAGPQARIILGFRAGVGRAEVERAAGSAALEPLLHAFRPVPGQVIPVPAGTVHAIGPDVLLYELQQNSDVTWRLWDWGRPRELHVQDALAVARIEPGRTAAPAATPSDDGGSWLLRERHFALRRYELGGPRTLATEGIVKIATLLRGRCALGWRSLGEHAPLLLEPADTVLLPASVGEVFLSPVGPAELLVAEPARR
jgi:mannose-6-phosphate isomerase